MKRAATWIWKHGIVSTFMTGFFVILPVALTLAIIGWVASTFIEWLGPESPFGRVLGLIGVGLLREETSAWIGTLLSWIIVLAAIWLLGALVKSKARQKIEALVHAMINRIPIVNAIYRPVSQVVSMLKQDENDEMSGMDVVYCSFGENAGGGFLALLASAEVFHFAKRDCHAVYIPTSPIPMSGGIVFVPVDKMEPVEMSVDELMQIYFSLGVMSSKVVPEQYRPKTA